MHLLWIDASTARRSAGALVIAGLLAGSLAPAAAAAGTAAPAALLGLCLALGGWVARGAVGPLAATLVLGGAGGLVAGLLAGHAPPGVGHAVLGLACGAALAGGRASLAATLQGGLPGAAGAVLGGALAGALAPLVASKASLFGGIGVEGGAAVLGGAVGLGLAGAEVLRHALLVRAEPPGWVAATEKRLDAEARPVLAAAIDGHRRCVEGLEASALVGWDKVELASLAQDLLAASARAADDAASALQAAAGLEADAGGALAGHRELIEARARIGASLAARRKAALDEAARHAAALTRLAAGLVAGGALEVAHDELDVAAATDDLGRRAALLERRVRAGGDLELRARAALALGASSSAPSKGLVADWPARPGEAT